MFAVLKTGGKQYKVSSGDTLRVEKLAADAGETVQFNDVLMLGGDSLVVGAPFVAGAAVQAEVLDQIKGDKVIHFVKRRRKHSSKRTKGHRQQLTLLRVTDILADGAEASGVKAAIGAGSVPADAKSDPADTATPKAKTAKDTAPKADMPKTAKPKTPKAKATKAATAEAQTAEPTRPGNLLDAPRDGTPDDLKKISGVGPKLEGLLHENGVYHFDQIAAWTTSEIAYMDDQLSFKGRIERDNWLDQAATFAAQQE